MAVLSKAAILAACDSKTTKLKVPEWKGEVIVKEWSLADADEYNRLLKEAEENGFGDGFRAKVVALTLVDDEGVRLFDSGADVEALNGKASAVLNKVFFACLKHNQNAVKIETDEPEKN